jgi:hypothetical protein
VIEESLKMSKERTMKPGISWASRVVLSLLVVGFSLIAIINVCKFMIVLFGLSMGILISSTIEVTRLSCLFIFVRKGKGVKALAVVTYILVAGVSFWCNVNAFTYEVIKREVAGRDHYRPQVHKIKQEYCRKVAEKVTGVAKEIKKIEQILSSYPKSATWKRRLATAVARHGSLVAKRDAFIKEEPENPEQWIRINSALLGMELPVKSRESEDIEAVAKTLKGLWGLNKAEAQQLMGVVITALVELSILLISFIAGAVDRSRNVADVAQKPREATEPHKTKKVAEPATGGCKAATPDIDEEWLERFVAAYKQYWEQTGELPQAKKLSRKFREVRKSLTSMSREELDKLFEK